MPPLIKAKTTSLSSSALKKVALVHVWLVRHHVLPPTHFSLLSGPGAALLYECHICDRKFKKQSDRDRHLYVHNVRVEQSVHVCELCQYETAKPALLDAHFMKVSHAASAIVRGSGMSSCAEVFLGYCSISSSMAVNCVRKNSYPSNRCSNTRPRTTASRQLPIRYQLAQFWYDCFMSLISVWECSLPVCNRVPASSTEESVLA